MTRFLPAVFAVIGLCLAVIPASVAHAIPPTGTEVSADITTNTTWMPAGSPYYITSYFFQVDAGTTLTIQPGVTVYVGNQFKVYGALIANGTPTQPITFDGPYGHPLQPATSTWNGLTLYSSPTANSLTNTVIESATRALSGPGVPAIRDDTFLDNEQAAFSQQGYPVTHSRFIGNAFAVGVLAGGSVTNSDFSGNQVAFLVSLLNGQTADVHQNNLYHNGIPTTGYQAIGYSVGSCSLGCSVDASGNWWGTDDPAAISPTLADCHNPNFPRYPCVDILPVAARPFDNGSLTPPAFAPSLSPLANANGWNDGDVSLSWDLSGLPPNTTTTGCSPSTFSSETAGSTATCTAFDASGTLSTSTVTIKIDKTPPTLAFSGDQNAYTIDQTVSIQCRDSDALSGIDSSTTMCPSASGPAYTFPLGTNTLQATAQDRAGNMSHATANFTVSVTFGSLCTLTTRFVTVPSFASELCSELVLAKNAAAHGDTTAKLAALALYRRQVDAHVTSAITADHAQTMDRLSAAL